MPSYTYLNLKKSKPIREKKCGVYSIVCLANKKTYYGSTRDSYNRICIHKCLLRKGQHINKDLQRDFDKYGESNFVFSMEEQTADILIARMKERQLIDIKRKDGVYNYDRKPQKRRTLRMPVSR